MANHNFTQRTITENGALFGARLASQSVRYVGRSKNKNGRSMFHLGCYAFAGLIAGFTASSLMSLHLSLYWTIAIGIAGALAAGFVSHLFLRPKVGTPFHPAGIVCSILGAFLILFLFTRLNVSLPA